jgi:hypothetical protein
MNKWGQQASPRGNSPNNKNNTTTTTTSSILLVLKLFFAPIINSCRLEHPPRRGLDHAQKY